MFIITIALVLFLKNFSTTKPYRGGIEGNNVYKYSNYIHTLNFINDQKLTKFEKQMPKDQEPFKRDFIENYNRSKSKKGESFNKEEFVNNFYR